MNTQSKLIELAPTTGPGLAPIPTPMDMLGQAVGAGASVEVLTKLMDLHERYERNMARRAFDAAMASVRSDLPQIVKSREVSFGTGKTSYKYEDLSAITEALSPVMAQHGLSFRWRTDTGDGKSVKVTCIIAHRDGHSEETTLSAGHDTSGNKNAIQALGSAVTYLQRYTLKAAIGIAAGVDDDAHAAGTTGPSNGNGEKITSEQVSWLSTLADEVGADKAKFCAYLKVESFADISAKDYARAVAALNAKKGKA